VNARNIPAAVLAAAFLVLAAEAIPPSRGARAPSPVAVKIGADPPAARAEQMRAAERAAGENVARAEREHGARSTECAQALADQAFLLWNLEEYEAGRPIAERALSIRLAAPAESREQAGSLYQAADFRRATGDYAGALAGYRGAIAAWTRLFGEGHAENGSAWHYMGILHALTGDPAGARACLRRALAVREGALGDSDPLVATTLHALGDLAARSGDPQAEELFARAQRIWERTLGPGDPFVARSLQARARLRAAAGDFATARSLLGRALAIRAAAFGPRHHLVARTRLALADLLARSGGVEAALAETRVSIGLLKETLGPEHPAVADALSDQARLLWSAGRRTDALVTALSAETMARERFRRSARDLDDGLALSYAGARTSGLDVLLTALAERTRDVEPAAAAREAFDALIRSRGMVLGARAESGDAGIDAVRDAIPSGGALVAYALYRRLAGPYGVAEPAYLAIVMAAGQPSPRVVPLGPAPVIEAAVSAWRDQVTRDPHGRAGEHREATASAAEDPETAARAAGERLRRAVWDPVAPWIAGASPVFVVPDGAIDLVAFGALPDDRDGYLVESGPLLHQLTTERSLVSSGSGAARGRGILSLGGPDFDAALAARAWPGALAARPLCPEFARLTFGTLPGAAGEAREVAALLRSGGDDIVLEGSAARADAFSQDAPGKRILHLATHAFVLPERCAVTPDRGSVADLDSVPTEHPLLRSGLAFAGANRRAAANAEAGAGRIEDGILTAEEIAGLDLSGVEWVVLSACDTGLGEIHAGEGVAGLRHAFERAGARTVIMSLWGADDASARAFMRALYAARSTGATTAEAMRRAAADLIAFQRAHGRTTQPYYWGGFVATGDWR
jgi:CHAT domain-containing protein/tetratricopeptide (TPR) repeat protein